MVGARPARGRRLFVFRRLAGTVDSEPARARRLFVFRGNPGMERCPKAEGFSGQI